MLSCHDLYFRWGKLTVWGSQLKMNLFARRVRRRSRRKFPSAYLRYINQRVLNTWTIV